MIFSIPKTNYKRPLATESNIIIEKSITPPVVIIENKILTKVLNNEISTRFLQEPKTTRSCCGGSK